MVKKADYTAVVTVTDETRASLERLSKAVAKLGKAFEGLTVEYEVEYRKDENNDK